MSKHPIKPAKLFIWDLDNCIYPYDDAFHNACHEAAGRAARRLGLQRNEAQALELARQSYKTRGTSFDIFIQDHGIPQTELHRLYHEELSLDFLRPDNRLNVGFTKSLKGGVTHAILTHGSTDWAHRVLRARQLDRHFSEGHIVGTEQLHFSKKHESRKPFEHMLGLTGHAPHEATMIEDTAANLKHPKEMGMQTVFISYGKGDGDGHADHVFDTAQDFLKAYCKEHALPARKR